MAETKKFWRGEESTDIDPENISGDEEIEPPAFNEPAPEPLPPPPPVEKISKPEKVAKPSKKISGAVTAIEDINGETKHLTIEGTVCSDEKFGAKISTNKKGS